VEAAAVVSGGDQQLSGRLDPDPDPGQGQQPCHDGGDERGELGVGAALTRSVPSLTGRMTARTTSLAKTTQKHDFPAAGDIARGWCRLMGPAPLTLFLTTLLVVRNQWILAWHHDGGGEVVAEEQLVLPAQQDVLAAPRTLRRRRSRGSRGAGEGLQVRPVHRQRRAVLLAFLRDRRPEQVIAYGCGGIGRQPVRPS
jgi:hypothetical protein